MYCASQIQQTRSLKYQTDEGLISPNPSPRGRRDSHIETLMESTSNYAEKEVLDFLLKSRTEEEKGGERKTEVGSTPTSVKKEKKKVELGKN